MGKLQVLDVLLAGNKEVYKPGDVIQGEARIVVSKEKGDIRGIRIECIGQAYTHWTESEGTGDNRSSVNYYTDHEYFRQEIILRGTGKNKSAANRITLAAGEHRFPFQFQIPGMSLPPPFEGTYGWVRYYVQIIIDRPWKFDHHTQKLFSIITVKDLNYELNVLAPHSHQVEKTVCCLCCASGPILLKGSIDKRGYVPGEYILVSLDLRNNSSRRIKGFTVKLQQKGLYSAQRRGTGRTHHRESVKTAAELKLDGCDAMGTVNYDRIRMLVPPIPPCVYENCPNIKVEYFIEIEAHVSRTFWDAHVWMPVVIGTIPAFQHTSKVPSQNPYAMQPIQGQPRSGQGQHGYPPPGQPGVPPPGQQEYPLPGHTVAPSQRQQGYPPEQPGMPSPESKQAGYPLPRGLSDEEGLPPPPTYTVAVGGPQQIESRVGSFRNIVYAPQYPCYDPDTLYAAMGIPQGAATSSADRGQTAPTVEQPLSIQQPPHQL